MERILKDQIERLVRLQEVETRFFQLERETRSIPAQIESAREALEKAQKEQKNLKSLWEEAGKERRSKERELEVCEEKLNKARDRQGEIKSNKEYQAHLHEIEVLKEEKGRIEEELLGMMDEADNSKSHEEEGAEKLKTAEKEFEKTQSALKEKEKTLKRELDQIEKQRNILSADVEGSVLKRYNRLMAQKKGEVVVPIKNGSCGGCYMNIPPQLVAEVKTGGEIHSCSQCRRILFWPEPSTETTQVKPNP